MEEIVAAIIGAIVSGAITWFFARGGLSKENTLLEAQLRDNKNEINRLSDDLDTVNSQVSTVSREATNLKLYKAKYLAVKQKLEASSVVRSYSQPVVLVGPRAVGKTSLVAQWHAPWDYSRLEASVTRRSSYVPIYDFTRENVEPHFADDDVKTSVHIHLKLHVHDFPGELSTQKAIKDIIIEESKNFRNITNKDIGIVLICMFDAEEAHIGISVETQTYYNGDLFRELRGMVSFNRAQIERLILVFNKYDRLKSKYPTENDHRLMNRCLISFKDVILSLKGVCNAEKVCEVFTVLSREDMPNNNRGAPIVLGEASRKFVETMAGRTVAQEVIKESATRSAAQLF